MLHVCWRCRGDDEHFAVELKAPTCCSTKEMEQQEAVISLLTPLEARFLAVSCVVGFL